MANKRMFSKEIVGSDAFQDMPASSQLLYFHLGMEADDDGFIGNPKKIARGIGMAEDDMKILVAKRFVLLFESGVLVIKHHRINNNWDKYNCKRTIYIEEFEQLYIKENKAYTKDKTQGIPLQSENSLKTVFRIEENRIEENISQRENRPLIDPTTGRKPRGARGFANAYRAKEGKLPLKKKLTEKQLMALDAITPVDDVIKKHRKMAEVETGTDYSFMDEDKNPQIHRLIALIIPKVEKHGKTMDDFLVFLKENSFAKEKSYNPLLCYTEAMFVHFLIGNKKKGGGGRV